MRIGDLNKRITLQSKTSVADGMGGTTDAFADVCTVWAAIWPTSAREQVEANQTVMTISHRVRIRYRSDIKASWKIKFGERYFAIVSIINPSERNQMLDLLCREAAS